MRVKKITGYVGVIDGKPVFASVSDDKGDCKAFDVYKTSGQALERWAHVRKVTIILGDVAQRSEDWGRL